MAKRVPITVETERYTAPDGSTWRRIVFPPSMQDIKVQETEGWQQRMTTKAMTVHGVGLTFKPDAATEEE